MTERRASQANSTPMMTPMSASYLKALKTKRTVRLAVYGSPFGNNGWLMNAEAIAVSAGETDGLADVLSQLSKVN